MQLAAFPLPTMFVELDVSTGLPPAGTPALHAPFGLPAAHGSPDVPPVDVVVDELLPCVPVVPLEPVAPTLPELLELPFELLPQPMSATHTKTNAIDRVMHPSMFEVRTGPQAA